MLARLAEYQARTVEVDGLAYREGLNAVGIAGGVAGNVIPDECVRHGQLPVRSGSDGGRGARRTCGRCSPATTCGSTDSAPGARPGLDRPAAASFVAGGRR